MKIRGALIVLLAQEGRAARPRRRRRGVFRTRGGNEAHEAVTVADALRRTGPREVVALSAERRIRSNPAGLLPAVRDIRVPVLSIDTRSRMQGRDTLAFAPARRMLVGGDAHGVELLGTEAVRRAILRFMREVAGA
jgi:hypothetical protein